MTNMVIRTFDSVLTECDGSRAKTADEAISALVDTFPEVEILSWCPYISQRLGLAEWIVSSEIVMRYRNAGIRNKVSA